MHKLINTLIIFEIPKVANSAPKAIPIKNKTNIVIIDDSISSSPITTDVTDYNN